MGNGSAWGGRLTCNQDIRRVRFSYSPLKYTLVAKRIRQRSSKALIVSSTLTEGAKISEFEISKTKFKFGYVGERFNPLGCRPRECGFDSHRNRHLPT